MIDCIVADAAMPPLRNEEFYLGNYSFGRFAWQTKDNRQLDHPVDVIGRQGFFNLPHDIEVKVRNKLK